METTSDHTWAPNVSQRIVQAGLQYEATGNLDAFIGELIVCICDLDLATMRTDPEEEESERGKEG